MMREHRRLIVWPSVIAAGLLAAACTDQPKVSMAPKPSFWVTPGPAQCTGGKWTGGGRIDPTNPPGPNHDAADETSGGQPPAFDPAPFNPEGKFTFGFNVFPSTPSAANPWKPTCSPMPRGAFVSWWVSPTPTWWRASIRVAVVNTRNSRCATTIVAGRKAVAPPRGSTSMRCAGVPHPFVLGKRAPLGTRA